MNKPEDQFCVINILFDTGSIKKSVVPNRSREIQFSTELTVSKPRAHLYNTNIDLLIGTDTCWEFVTGEIQRCKSCSLVAQKLILGYLVSGPQMYDSFKQVNPTHVMNIAGNQDNSLSEKIERFWDL